MRDFSIVLPQFWTGTTGRILRQYPAEVRELAFYLFTAPNADMYGLYYKPLETMALETGRDMKAIAGALDTLVTVGYCQYDRTTEFVWVFEMAGIQMRPLPLKPTDFKVKSVNRWYRGIQKNPFLGAFFDRYCDHLLIEPPRRDGSPLEGASKPLISISGSTALVVREERSVPVERSVQTARFERFWEVYPKKVGKKMARAYWDKLNPNDEFTERIVQAVIRHRRSDRWRRDGGTAIPDPERYIKYERFNDEVLDAAPTMSRQTQRNVGEFGTFLDQMEK